MTERAPLEAAIADLESRRAVLGDAVVDASVAALRARLAALDAALPPPPRPAPPAGGARMRQLSILFADIADSTALLGGLAADEALAVVSAALERFAAEVRAEGGEVLRFTGDGLKAAFGTQGTRGDEAERAVRSGLAILRAARAHAERVARTHGRPRFEVRVGVHSGPVVLGAGAEADRTAMGHAVHLAARLEQSAPLGALRISHETWVQVRGLFEAAAQPPLFVKGHAEPLATWIVSRELPLAERAALRGVDGVSTPLVGRAAEWALLCERAERVRSARRPEVVWVIAEAGLGKTRLRRELIAAQPQARVLQARAHPSETLQPFGLVRQQLARWCGIPDDLPADAARERFVQALAPRLGPDGAPRARRLGHLIGLDFTSEPAVQALGARELHEQGFGAWRDALRHAAGDASPLIVVLDDLHWADRASFDFVQRLAADPGAPMLLLLLTRPALFEQAPRPAAGEGVSVIALAPLAGADGAALADALLEPVVPPSPALHALLVERAAGNPFFMEELLRMLIDRGAVAAARRPWRVDEERLDARRVPETLVGVLQARLDALPADELAALQQASIVGAVFWDAALAELDERAPRALPSVERRGLVQARPASAFANTAEHAFQHALLHDVTYATVLSAVRREGHARVARWLAGRMAAGRGGEFLAVTASHFERAGDAARAYEFYDRARSQSANRSAYTESLALGERALALAAAAAVPPRRRFQLGLSRATSLEHLGRAAEVRQAHAELAALAEAEDDDAMRADVEVALMLLADHEGRPDEARRRAEQALALVQRDGRPWAAGAGALAHGELAWLALQRGDHEALARHIEAGVVQARVCAQVPREEGGYDGYETQLRIIEAHALTRRGRFADAAASVERTVQTLAGLAQPRLLDHFHLLGLRFSALLALGDLPAATAAAAESDALAARIEMPRTRAAALAQRAQLALHHGDAAAVRAAADEVERICKSIGFAQHLPQVPAWRAELAERAGDGAAALRAWHDAAAAHREQGDESGALQAECRRAVFRLQTAAPGERDAVLAEARRCVDQALAAHPQEEGLNAEALLACHDVLQAAADARAAALRELLGRRLRSLFAQCADAAARERLLAVLPHWRRVAALLDMPAT